MCLIPNVHRWHCACLVQLDRPWTNAARILVGEIRLLVSRHLCVCVCVSGVHISLVKRTRHGITASNRVSSLWRISSVYLNRHTLILHFKWAVSFSCSAKVANPTTLYNVLGLQLTHYRDQAEKCSTGLFPVHSLKWTSNGCGCSNVNASA